jgi:hypothetical protein
MPPKRVVQVQRGGAPQYQEPKGFFGSTYDALTNQENRAVLTSIAAFGVRFPLLATVLDFLLTCKRLLSLFLPAPSERLSSCKSSRLHSIIPSY